MLTTIPLRREGHFSPLRYPGGKAPLAGFLGKAVSQCERQDQEFAEAFAGGAGAALSVLLKERVRRIVINDLDPAVFAFWSSVVGEAERFAQRIESCELSIPEWRRQREVYKAGDRRNSFDLGFAFFYLNRTNRSGIVEGWPIGGIDQRSKWSLDARFNRSELAKRVRLIGLYSSRIRVSNDDGAAFSERFLEENRGFLYLDPPYFAKGKSLYLNHFQAEHHETLASCLKKFCKEDWILTYDNQPTIVNLYEKLPLVEFALNYSAYEHKKGSEIMVFSPSIDLVKLLGS